MSNQSERPDCYVLMTHGSMTTPLHLEPRTATHAARTIAGQAGITTEPPGKFAITRYEAAHDRFVCIATGQAYIVVERGIYTASAFAEFRASLTDAGLQPSAH